MKTRKIFYSFGITILAICIVISVPTNSLAQISDAPEGLLGGQFRDDTTEKLWLDITAFRGRTYGELVTALQGSSFALASRAEVQELFSSLDRIELAMGSPSGGGQAGEFSGIYNDDATGVDPSRFGSATAIDIACTPNSIPQGCGYSESVTDDVVQIDSGSILTGSWVVQRIASSCSSGAHRQDFDCDGADEKVVWRPSTGTFFVRFGNGEGFLSEQWGLPGDQPVVGDYDGDGVPDLVVWRPSNGTWYVKTSASLYDSAQAVVQQFGLPGDKPVRADFDGDGVLDFSVWRPNEGNFYYRRSSDGQVVVVQWGLPDDVPVGNFAVID